MPEPNKRPVLPIHGVFLRHVDGSDDGAEHLGRFLAHLVPPSGATLDPISHVSLVLPSQLRKEVRGTVGTYLGIDPDVAIVGRALKAGMGRAGGEDDDVAHFDIHLYPCAVLYLAYEQSRVAAEDSCGRVSIALALGRNTRTSI